MQQRHCQLSIQKAVAVGVAVPMLVRRSGWGNFLSLSMSEKEVYRDLGIRRLELQGVGPFRDLKLEFPHKRPEDSDKAEVHIFVGENGTGKTTLLEAMTAFEGWYGKTRTAGGGLEPNPRSEWRFERKLWSDQSTFLIGYGSDDVVKTDGIFRVPMESYFKDYLYGDPDDLDYLFFCYQPNRFLKTVFVQPGGSLDEPRFANEGIKWDKDPYNKGLFQWVMNCYTKAAFAQSRGKNEKAMEWRSDLNRINEAVSKILHRYIAFVIDEERLHVAVEIGKSMQRVEALPMGYQSILSWLADLIYRLSQFPGGLNSRFTLFLDEIDIHLHPKAQRNILPVIQKLFPHAQIFITTHSPFVVGSVDGAWVYKFKLDAEGYSVLDGEPRLSEDADSYRTILEETFDVQEQFGIAVQAQLDEFYKLRQEVLSNGSEAKWLKFNELGKHLASQSMEMHQYVSFELRQAARVLNRQLTF